MNDTGGAQGKGRPGMQQAGRFTRPSLAPQSRDGVDTSKSTSILAALERGSSRNPRRLPWHLPLLALSLAGALLWGYAWWPTRAPSANNSPEAAKVVARVAATSPREAAGAGKDSVLGATTVAVVASALESASVGDDAKTSDKGHTDKPAMLVDVQDRVAGRSDTLRADIVERRAVRPAVNAKRAPVASARATPTKSTTALSTTKVRLPGAMPASHPRAAAPVHALDDVDVAVVSALIGSRRTWDVEPPSAALTQQPMTIAGLVRQCRALDLPEAAACRRRICEGYWGKAQACTSAVAERKTAQR